ncbi:MAG: hypothetical protein ABIQ61_07875 [Ornithinibacter sp.]
MPDWNQQIIEEFRANDGTVSPMGFGRGLVLLHHIGARSSTERDAAWSRFTQMSDGFRSYEQKTSRVIPVIELTRREP